MTTQPTQTLFRPVGRCELELIEGSQWQAFPPRLPGQPFFYPVLNEGYATQIARDWNTRDEASGFVGHVTRFEVCAEYLAGFEVRCVGGAEHLEYWIPAAGLPGFNAKLVGAIELVASFGAEGS